MEVTKMIKFYFRNKVTKELKEVDFDRWIEDLNNIEWEKVTSNDI